MHDDEGHDDSEAVPAERDATPGLDDVVSTLARESTLWPLGVVIVGSLGALGAALLVLVFVDRNPFAAAALLLVVGMTLDVGWRARSRPRLRPIAAGVGLVWAASIALSVLAGWFGLA